MKNTRECGTHLLQRHSVKLYRTGQPGQIIGVLDAFFLQLTIAFMQHGLFTKVQDQFIFIKVSKCHTPLLHGQHLNGLVWKSA